MGRLAILGLVATVGLCGAAVAAGGPSEPLPLAPPADQREDPHLEPLRRHYADGQWDRVIEGGGALIRNPSSEDSKTEAMRLVAEAARKKGDWRLAAEGFVRLRDRFDKGSDPHIRYEAVAQVLRQSREGVYPSAPGAGPPTLADDAALEKALLSLAEARAAKLGVQARAVAKARTPEEVAAAFAALADGFRRARAVAPALVPDAERQAADAADKRLGELMVNVAAALRVKQTELQKIPPSRTIPQAQRKEAEDLKAMCERRAGAEAAYQKALATVGGSEWPGREALRTQSEARQARYAAFAQGMVLPAPTPSTRDWVPLGR